MTGQFHLFVDTISHLSHSFGIRFIEMRGSDCIVLFIPFIIVNQICVISVRLVRMENISIFDLSKFHSSSRSFEIFSISAMK